MNQLVKSTSTSSPFRTGSRVPRGLVLISLILALQVALPAMSFAASLHFTGDTKIRRSDKTEFVQVPAGSTVDVGPGESVLVLTQRGIPMLVLGASSKEAKIEVFDPDLATVVKERLGPAIEEATREIVNELRRTEALIQRQDLQGARSVIAPLKAKYPNQSSVLFLSASVSYLLGDQLGAAADLKNGLAIDPKNESALKLLGRLKGAQ